MKLKSLAIALVALAPAGTCLAQSGMAFLDPSSNGYSEFLPSQYAFIQYTVGNNDWLDRIRLPFTHATFGQQRVIINNNASGAHALTVNAEFSHLPLDYGTLTLGAGSSLAFDKRDRKWHVDDRLVRKLIGPNERRWRIPSQNRKPITTLALHDGYHVGEIGLPDEPRAYDTVTISNHASWPTTVIANDTLFPGAQLKLHSGDIHHYVFDPHFRKWKLAHASLVPVSPQTQHEIPAWPRTLVSIKSKTWTGTAQLPRSAKDRDRRVIRQDTVGKPTSVVGENIFGHAANAWDIKPWQSMEFIFIDDGAIGSGQWHATKYPVRSYTLKNLNNGMLPDTRALLSVVKGDSGTLTLPSGAAAPATSRVVVENTARESGRTLTAIGPGLTEHVKPGEQVSFRATQDNGQTHWMRETTTLDIVLAVSTRLGEIETKGMALELMRESLKKTNDALDNSGATFRFREAAVRDITVPYYLPTYAIPEWIANHASQVISDSGADGVFFGGVADGCNGFHHSKPRKQFAVAMNLLCPTDMLREEMGKALGMKVNGMQGVPVIGSGNKLPLYPTPVRLVDDGNRAINPGQRDEVQHMNGVAAEVARYGHAR